MLEKFDPANIISKTDLRQLLLRSDRKSLAKLIVHLSLFVSSFVLLAVVELPTWLFIPALLAFGFLTFSLYAPYHECTHENLCACPENSRKPGR